MNEFYERAKPIRFYVSNYEFVEPIDYGQLEKDRQKQIDSAFSYIGGTEFTNKSRGVHRKNGSKIPLFIGGIIVAYVIGMFALDYFNIFNWNF